MNLLELSSDREFLHPQIPFQILNQAQDALTVESAFSLCLGLEIFIVNLFRLFYEES
jgi:hypothetical protein